MNDWPDKIEDDKPEAPVKKPAPQRPKMALTDQAAFMGRLCNKFRMRDGCLAEETLHLVTQDDMLRLETVWQTLLFMELHGADRMVTDKIARDRRASMLRK